MRKLLLFTAWSVVLVAAGLVLAGTGTAAEAKPVKPVRELLVPFEDLHVLLGKETQRVLLSRKEYEDLLERAKKTARARAPRSAALVSAQYDATLGDERALITGTLTVDVLEEGLHTVGLDLGSVGLIRAAIDGAGAPIGLADDGRLMLFVEGVGQHTLTLEMVAPLQTTAARQILNFRLPTPPAARMTLTVPGDVEVKSGAPVVSRVFDEDAGNTTITLLPPRQSTTLVMTLNSRLRRRDRVVVAKSIIVDEVTEAYDRLHATFSMAVLHRATDRFRFALPDGFEVTDVRSPQLARWAVDTTGTRKVLDVRLREETTGTVVLGLSAVRTKPDLSAWRLPKFEPLDVAGHTAVVGLLLEDRLKAASIRPSGLIAIDVSVLKRALPSTVLEAEPGAARLRPVAAYYAPHTRFDLAATFPKPPAKLRVTTSLVLTVEDSGHRLQAAFAVLPEEEKVFALSVSIPAGWEVTRVAADGAVVPFERYGPPNQAGRIHIRLPKALPVGEQKRIDVQAVRTPKGWFDEWTTASVALPVLAVSGASRDVGAVAVDARDDMTVRPQSLQRLTPLDENRKRDYGLAGVPAALAYRYEGQPWGGRMIVERTKPRLTAQTFSFFRIERDALHAHYELIYDVVQARTRRVSLLLPVDTPTALSIKGLDGVHVKEPTSEVLGEMRRWTALLTQRHRGEVKLAVEFQQRLSEKQLERLTLPAVRADGVVYQSGIVSVEGSPEIDVKIVEHPRKVDIGELVDAKYQPGRRLLGTFAFVGDPPPVIIGVSRHPAYALPPAIVQQAELTTAVSTDRLSQTAARFRLRTKALFLEVKLPEGSTLWSVTLDGRPAKPQREGDRLLLSLPAAGGTVRELLVVYETPIQPIRFWSNIEVLAPELFLHAQGEVEPVKVPVADLIWHLYVPTGHRLVRSAGTVVTEDIWTPTLAAADVVVRLVDAAGGMDIDHGILAPMLATAGHEAARRVTYLAEEALPATIESETWVSSPAHAAPAETSGEKAYVARGFKARPGREHGGRDKGGAVDSGLLQKLREKRYALEEVIKMDQASRTNRFRQKDEMSRTMRVRIEAVDKAINAEERRLRGRRPRDGKEADGDATVVYNGTDSMAEVPDFAATTSELETKLKNARRSGRTETAKKLGEDLSRMKQQQAQVKARLNYQYSTFYNNGKYADALAVLERMKELDPQDAEIGVKLRDTAQKEQLARRQDIRAGRPFSSATYGWDPTGGKLEGLRSLRIDLEKTGHVVTFRSLGTEPRLAVTITNVRRLGSLTWGLALTVLLTGVVMTRRTVREKTTYILAVVFAATVLPLVVGIETALVFNGAFCAACALVPYYLVAGLVRRLARKGHESAPVALAVLLVAVGLAVGATPVNAQQKDGPYVVKIVPPGPPVEVPKDAIILPYDPERPRGVPAEDKLLLPYSEFVRLWNLAYPDRKIETEVLPAPYALSGAAFRARLEGDAFLLIEGHVDIDVYTGKYASVPLPLDGGVLAKADLDGKPARLSVVNLGRQTQQTMQQEQVDQQKGQNTIRGGAARSFIVLHVTGKGKHRLDLAVRMKLDRRGGWRVATGRLPAAPATALTLEVPSVRTELRLGGIADRRTYETATPNQTIKTALGVNGELSLQWRPKVLEGQTDKTLTCQSDAQFDVQEDRLQLVWSLSLSFRRGEREFFSIDLPADYLVEKVVGTNVRGWEVKRSGRAQQLEIALLKKAKGHESLSVHLWLPRSPATGTFTDFDVPVVGVTGAIRHSGQVSIRRSPLLEVRTAVTRGVTRTDFPSVKPSSQPDAAVDASPLTLRPYQAFKFVRTPFTVKLATAPVTRKASAVVQTFLKIAQIERALESRVSVTARNRRLYRVRIMLPADLNVEQVLVERGLAPEEYEWALTDEPTGKVLTLYLNRGIEGTVPVLVRGTLGREQEVQSMMLPRLKVLDVERQQGDVAVQVDPAFDVRADRLRNIETVLPERVHPWLAAPQRRLMRLALHYKRPDYSGRLVLTARKPDVTCRTLTNVRVTDRALMETVLVDFAVRNTGIREVSLVLPERMKDARFKVRLLRQKHVEPVTLGEEKAVRVRLELQDAVMDQLRVIVENDRLLTEAENVAPVPVVETGRTLRRYVTLELESTVRDEVVIRPDENLEELGPRQKVWAEVQKLLRGGITRAYAVKEGAIAPRLAFRTKARKLVETPEARIGLAHTVVVLDTNGAYRAQQVFTMNNTIEQFLDLALPEAATLWTARVDGRLVKPTRDPGRTEPNHVRIPLVKTAEGDLDYEVVLKYGGKLPALHGLRRVRMPLVRTVNIQAEKSIAELHLPETHRWFRFGGTMRLEEVEGVLAEGITANYNEQFERLLKVDRYGNPYAQSRAKENLKTLVSKAQVAQQSFQAFGSNVALQDKLNTQFGLIKEAGKRIKQKVQTETTAGDSNRDFMNKAFEGQRNVRAFNRVQELGWNFVADVPVKVKEAAVGRDPDQVTLNPQWLVANNLVAQPPVTRAPGVDTDDFAKKSFDWLEGGQRAKLASKFARQPKAPQAAALDAQGLIVFGDKVTDSKRVPAQQKRELQQLVQRYQKSLETRSEVERAEGRAQWITSGGQLTGVGHGGGGGDHLAGKVSGAFADDTILRGKAWAGLASLDVDLPMRGQHYRFTTPRGDVEITAYAVSAKFLGGLKPLGIVLIVLAVVVLVRELTRRGVTLGLAAQSVVSTVMIVFGPIGLLFGIFPVLGLVVLIAGIIWKVLIRRARRRAAATA